MPTQNQELQIRKMSGNERRASTTATLSRAEEESQSPVLTSARILKRASWADREPKPFPTCEEEETEALRQEVLEEVESREMETVPEVSDLQSGTKSQLELRHLLPCLSIRTNVASKT